MSGTVEFFKQKVKCPSCEEEIVIDFVVDIPTNGVLTPPEICGGKKDCPYCGYEIKDEDLEDI